jgi:hypothetical protein
VAIIRLSKSPSWGLVVVCISVGRSIQKLSFKTFAEIPNRKIRQIVGFDYGFGGRGYFLLSLLGRTRK